MRCKHSEIRCKVCKNASQFREEKDVGLNRHRIPPRSCRAGRGLSAHTGRNSPLLQICHSIVRSRLRGPVIKKKTPPVTGLHRGVSAVYGNHDAGHIGGRRGSQEDGCRVKLALVAVSLQRNHGLGILLEEIAV